MTRKFFAGDYYLIFLTAIATECHLLQDYFSSNEYFFSISIFFMNYLIFEYS